MAVSAKSSKLQSTILLDIIVKTLTVFDADIERLHAYQKTISQLLASCNSHSDKSLTKKQKSEIHRELNNVTRLNLQLDTNLRNFASLKDDFAQFSNQNPSASTVKDIAARIEKTERRVRETVADFNCKIQGWHSSVVALESSRSDNATNSSALQNVQHALLNSNTSDDAIIGDPSDDFVAAEQNGRIAISNDEVELGQEVANEADLEVLASDMQAIRDMYQTVRDAVEEQNVAVTNVEDHVEVAHENVQRGSLALRAAARAKQAALPISGMLIGAAFGGPVGLAVGLKVGLVAAASGAGVGYMSGRMIKNKMQKQEEPVELTRLSS